MRLVLIVVALKDGYSVLEPIEPGKKQVCIY